MKAPGLGANQSDTDAHAPHSVSSGRFCAIVDLWQVRQPPVLTNWLVTFLGRDRSDDITAARRDLGYNPPASVADGLAEMGV